MPPAKALTGAAIMPAPGAAAGAAGAVRADQRIAAIAPRLRDASAPLVVVDGEGRPVGEVTRDAVADVMLRG